MCIRDRSSCGSRPATTRSRCARRPTTAPISASPDRARPSTSRIARPGPDGASVAAASSGASAFITTRACSERSVIAASQVGNSAESMAMIVCSPLATLRCSRNSMHGRGRASDRSAPPSCVTGLSDLKLPVLRRPRTMEGTVEVRQLSPFQHWCSCPNRSLEPSSRSFIDEAHALSQVRL